MTATEADVSVLIPAFRRPEMTLRAVSSALATGAGEISVSLDTDPDRVASALGRISDRRLRIQVQRDRLGLWPNHLALLRQSTLPYVKFLQTDDVILDGGLLRLCAETSPQTAIVSGLPYYVNLATGETWRFKTKTLPGRWSSSDYLLRAATSGNELGRPSYTLVRRDAISEDELYWRNGVSADWLMNLHAAGKGEVAIVEPGTVVCGVHGGQDGTTQSLELVSQRLTNTLGLLATLPDCRYRDVVAVQAAVAMLTIVRNALGQLARGGPPAGRDVSQYIGLLYGLAGRTVFTSVRGWRLILAALGARRVGRKVAVDRRIIDPKDVA